MRVSDFDFLLPPECIATRPVSPRDSARLLHLNGQGMHDRIVRDLPKFLRPGDVMVFNDTRVIPARLFGRRGEAKVEALLHHSISPDTWQAFARPAKRLRVEDRIDFADDLAASVVEKLASGEVVLRFDRSGADLMRVLETRGRVPLPPYIHRDADTQDRSDYQTVYAREGTSVAAPTAGLHFTPELLAAIDARGVKRVTVTLHVGAGTFQPVKVEDTRDHAMHAEVGEVSAETAAAINAARAGGGRVVAVGTTSCRLLETAADETGRVHPWSGETGIFITPGYRFRMVDVLMTNFHLPKSTLFMLVCAFAGTERMKTAYAHAIETGYRFYSYGDACLLEA